MKFKAILPKIFPILSLLFLIGIFSIFKQEIAEFDFLEIVNSLSRIANQQINLAILLTCVGYFVIAHYDKIAFVSEDYSLKNSKILTTTFISYAICNNIGFTLLIGGAIRYYFYNYYHVPKNIIIKAIAFSNLNFWLGLFAVGGITFIINPIEMPDLLQSNCATVRPLGIIFLSLIIIYLYFSWQQQSLTIRGQTFLFPSLSISLAQILISSLDWAIASAVLYILLPYNLNLSYGSFFGIYLLGVTAKIISNIPGGLGVFETIIIYFIPQQVTTNDALGSLLAYRGIYFLLPLFTSLILLALYTLRKKMIV